LLRLEVFDEKIASAEMTAHDARTYNALQNSLRLALRELGLKGRVEKVPSVSLADVVARHAKAAPA
jgi:hypothetical protein